MGKQLSPDEMRLYRRTDEVLHYLWDPIGVAGIPAARDEYDFYVPAVYTLLAHGAGKREIAEYLDTVVRDRMGLEGRSRRRTLEIAEILVEYRAWIAEHPDIPS